MQNAASDFSLPKIQRSTFVRNYSMNLQSEQVYVYGFLPTFRNSAANQFTIVGIVHVHIYILLTVCMYKYTVCSQLLLSEVLTVTSNVYVYFRKYSTTTYLCTTLYC